MEISIVIRDARNPEFPAPWLDYISHHVWPLCDSHDAVQPERIAWYIIENIVWPGLWPTEENRDMRHWKQLWWCTLEDQSDNDLKLTWSKSFQVGWTIFHFQSTQPESKYFILIFPKDKWIMALNWQIHHWKKCFNGKFSTISNHYPHFPDGETVPCWRSRRSPS